MRSPKLLFSLLILAVSLPAASRLDRYALVLEDPPLLMRSIEGKEASRRLAGADLRRKIETSQQAVRTALADSGVLVLGSSHRLVNAVYVRASEGQLESLRNLAGVVRVEKMLPWKRHVNRAQPLMAVEAAWPEVGGVDKAGDGVIVGILDTGIDTSNPTFDGSSFSAPPGYPICAPQDCAFTNNKVIIARSYVESLVLGNDPTLSRPDDLSPRDRVGHGTAVAMIAAGLPVTSPLGSTVSGVAPRAYLGSYKVFGSPGVNDVTFDDVIMQALEDAVVDGVDVVVLAIGDPATWGIGDRGAICDNPGVEPCDLRFAAVENAVDAGLAVVVSAGNDGDLALRFPARNSINTPGAAPSVITVGATTNSHILFSTLSMTGDGVSAELRDIPALFGDGPRPGSPLTAPVRDVSKTEPDGFACNPLGAGTMNGAIAVVDRGNCSFADKINHAQRAGAVGVVVVHSEDGIFPMTGLIETGIPAAMIGNSDGQNSKNFLQTNLDRPGVLDPTLMETDADFDTTASFTSRGPGVGESHLEPKLVAVGTDLGVVTQTFDPNGDMWSPDGFTSVQGTSFAAPFAAGAAALVLQQNPSMTPAQVESALVNVATDSLTDFDEFGNRIPAGVTAVGAGKLNVLNSVRTTITAEPATISFGEVDAGGLPARVIVLTNHGAQTANLTAQIEPADSRIQLSVDAMTLDPGFSGQITVRLAELPGSGSFEGFLVIRGGAVDLRVPYLYLRGDGVADNMLWLNAFTFVGNVDDFVPGDLLFKVVDQYGVPVRDAPIRFTPAAQIDAALERTDHLGIGWASAFLGLNPGPETFTAEVEGFSDLFITFEGRSRLLPSVSLNGVVDAASGLVGQGLAPGSYISIFGRSLSEAFKVFNTPYMPLSLAGVSVSFDVPERGISVPGRIHVVSESQVNVIIPWELLGLNSVRMKISIGQNTSSPVVVVPLNDYLPAFFEITDVGGTGRRVVAALDGAFRIIASNNPVPGGQVAQLFVNGLGPVSNQPASGEPSPSSPLAETLERPTVTIGGWDAPVSFSGLAPGIIALYQVNVTVPSGLAPGLYEVVITIGGVTSKTGFLYVG